MAVRARFIEEPRLLATSEAHGWGELVAREYIEPPHMELWQPPPIPVLTIGLVTSGTMDLEQRTNGAGWRGQTVFRDHLFLQSYHQPYELRWHEHSPEPIRTLMLKLHQHTLFNMIAAITDRDPAAVVFAEQIGFADPMLLHLGSALLNELRAPSAIGPLYAQTAAQMLVVHLLRDYTTANTAVWTPKHGLSSQQLKRVYDLVQSQLAHDLPLGAMAEHVGLSAYHFARMFRQATGESPHQFVMRLRLERAAHLLQTTDIPVATVATDCGFASQSYLATAFKRRFGLSPLAYRQHMQ